LPACTSAQNYYNEPYCNWKSFNPAICGFDDGIYCPSRCNVCSETFTATEGAFTVTWAITLNLEPHEFDHIAFKQRLSEALSISPAQITLTVASGSLQVDSLIVTTGGSLDEANDVTSSINHHFPTPAAASAALEVPVEEVDVPTTHTITDDPPSPPAVPLPSAPPYAPGGAPEEDNGMSVGLILAIVVPSLIAAFVVVGLGLGWFGGGASGTAGAAAAAGSGSGTPAAASIAQSVSRQVFQPVATTAAAAPGYMPPAYATSGYTMLSTTAQPRVRRDGFKTESLSFRFA
jgi:hypothetical protein